MESLSWGFTHTTSYFYENGSVFENSSLLRLQLDFHLSSSQDVDFGVEVLNGKFDLKD